MCCCANIPPCGKFHPYAAAAAQQGKKIYHLNIGQPDIKTPEAFFAAVRNFQQDVLAYCPSQGLPEMIEAVRQYYCKLGASFETKDILITTGASEGLLFLMQAILDAGSEVITPEPFYPNYETCALIAGGALRPIMTRPENGYRYATREQIEPLINKKTRAIMLANRRTPPAIFFRRRRCGCWRISPLRTISISLQTRSTGSLPTANPDARVLLEI